MTEQISVVILAAGLGTRMKSKKAKVLHRAGGLTLVEHVVRTALTQAAPANVITVVGHQAAQVQETLKPYGIEFAHQTEQKGTGHAVAVCTPAMSARQGLVVILYGDSPLLSSATLARLIDSHRKSGAAATVITTELEDPTGYGRILQNAAGDVVGIVEQKAATQEQLAIREINSGIYCFAADLLWRSLPKLSRNPASGEYYLTDIVEMLANDGHRIARMPLSDASEVLGINTRVELALVDRLFRERKARELMLQGVTIEKPETVTIDVDVQVGMDTVIGSFAQLLGKCIIGEDCRIGAGSILEDMVLGDRVQVQPYSLLAHSRVGVEAQIGPFARLRMENEVGAKAHIGNFVELKKTKFGNGSKASHLAYLGDALIGEGVNVGAGTITCNYDGVHKHPTNIGDGVFVGSNSTLVAPVTIGDGSYIGAGSVITEPVEPDSLALGRSRQIRKPGWAKRKREERAAK